MFAYLQDPKSWIDDICLNGNKWFALGWSAHMKPEECVVFRLPSLSLYDTYSALSGIRHVWVNCCVNVTKLPNCKYHRHLLLLTLFSLGPMDVCHDCLRAYACGPSVYKLYVNYILVCVCFAYNYLYLCLLSIIFDWPICVIMIITVCSNLTATKSDCNDSDNNRYCQDDSPNRPMFAYRYLR